MTNPMIPSFVFAVWVADRGIWRSSQPDFYGGWANYSATWPIWGSMRRGLVFRPVGLGRAIRECVSSSSPGPLLRTPLASDASRGNSTLEQVRARGGQVGLGHQLLDFARRHGDHPNRPVWGRFAPAIDHWAGIVDRDPPPPVTTTARGAVNPNPAVVEWLMGLPEGWVTSPDTGLSPARQVKALGNGVLPHQARLAISALHRYTTQDR